MVSMLSLVDVFMVRQAHALIKVYVSGQLGTGFDGDSGGISLGIDKLIELGFQIYILRSVAMEILAVL